MALRGEFEMDLLEGLKVASILEERDTNRGRNLSVSCISLEPQKVWMMHTTPVHDWRTVLESKFVKSHQRVVYQRRSISEG
jgi:hypothetical protein